MAKKIGKKVNNVIVMDKINTKTKNWFAVNDVYSGINIENKEDSNFNLNNREKIEAYLEEMKWA